jgi:hypothetical protein
MLRPLPAFAYLATTLLALADPIDTATLAAMRLGEAPNYSWNSSVIDDARTYVKVGKHVRNGFTWVTLPMVESVSRRLGRAAGTEIEAIFGANDTCVIRLGDRWKSIRQLPKARSGADEMCLMVIPANGGLRTPDMPADAAELDPFPPVIVITPSTYREEDENKPYSTASLAASPPHEELALIVSSWANVKIEGDRVTGLLNDTGARLLLCPGSDLDAAPLAAGGEFTLHVKDKRVTRYQLTLEGVLRVGKKKKILVRQSSDTWINAVGSTAFIVPDEARLKLGAIASYSR